MKRVVNVLIAIILISCLSNQQKDNVKKQMQEENYIIPDTLCSFFQEYSNQKSKPIMYITNAGDTDLPYFAEEFAITYIVKGFSCQDTAWFTRLREALTSKGALKIKSGEDSYFVIGSERDMLSSFDTINLREQYQDHLNIPLVLNFHEIFKETQNLYDKTTISGLPRDYEILIIKKGNEYVLPEKYKFDWNFLPESIKHGYANGVAYSKKELSILYWAVAW